jgi:hypothetical protein
MSNFDFHDADERGAKGAANPRPEEERDKVDESSEESFPASDPPAWEPTHTGAPVSEPSPPHDVEAE